MEKEAFVTKIDFMDWIDIKNPDHLYAITQLIETGSWASGFIPTHVEFHYNWYNLLLARLALGYIKLSQEVKERCASEYSEAFELGYSSGLLMSRVHHE